MAAVHPQMPTNKAEIQVLADADALARAAAERFVASAADAMQSSGRFVVALAGGSTPKSLYVLLASSLYAPRLDWSRVHVFWGDERCVPPDDARSNYHMSHQSLLDRARVPPSNVHRIRGEDDPGSAAASYERELREMFATPDGPPRTVAGGRFDLVLLGMGDNGHTASLFPGLAAVRETERWVMAEYVEEVSMWRVTLTPIVINAAAEVEFLVSGGAKAATLQRVLEGPRDPAALPAQVVAPRNGRLRWLVDAAAAANLQQRSKRS
jgi:6-phosphogluconolactonase